MRLGRALLGVVLAFLLGCLLAFGVGTLPEQPVAKHVALELQNSPGPSR